MERKEKYNQNKKTVRVGWKFIHIKKKLKNLIKLNKIAILNKYIILLFFFFYFKLN